MKEVIRESIAKTFTCSECGLATVNEKSYQHETTKDGRAISLYECLECGTSFLAPGFDYGFKTKVEDFKKNRAAERELKEKQNPAMELVQVVRYQNELAEERIVRTRLEGQLRAMTCEKIRIEEEIKKLKTQEGEDKIE